MEKVWLKSYQQGVPDQINPDQYVSLIDIFEEACQKYSDKPAYNNLGKSLTYGDVYELTNILACFLQHNLGLKKGDKIALMMPNCLQYPVALFAALRLGLWVVNINPLYTARELKNQLSNSGATTIIVLANFAHTVSEVLSTVPIQNILVTELGDMLGLLKGSLVNFVLKYVKNMVPDYPIPKFTTWKTAFSLGKKSFQEKKSLFPHGFAKPIMSGEDMAFLQYTGGTTGVAKGAMLTHRNMVANLEQASAWLKPYIHKGEEIIITALPMYHIFSLTANCLTFFKMGALNVLITNPRDMQNFVKELAKYPFTAITGVNTLFNGLLNNEKFVSLDFSHLSLALAGGMALQHAVAEKWQKITKVPLLQAYGLTETSPAVCISPINITHFNNSVGLPIPSTEISIRDEDENELGFNEPGELWVRGPQVIKGYWKQEAETQKALTNDGWLKTGDIAEIDEKGFVRIVDREKDIILVSGFNVYPNEVEDVIADMGGVAEVAVIGMPYRDSERVRAYIVKKEPTLTEEDVIKHCRKLLTPYKIPKSIIFRNDLPKTMVGKISRRALREEMLQSIGESKPSKYPQNR